MRFSFILFAVFGVFLLAKPAVAEVKVGDALPSGLTFIDKDGEGQDFNSVKGKKGAVLVFVRSADWCPFCQKQLIELRDFGGPITDMGYEIVSISYDLPDAIKMFAVKHRIPFTMLSDQGSEAIKAFGILDEEQKPGTFSYGIPRPHVYVVSEDGIVKAVLAEEGYKKRPQIEQIIEVIKEVRK